MICQKSQSISNKLPKLVRLDHIPSNHVFCSFLVALGSEYKWGVQSSGFWLSLTLSHPQQTLQDLSVHVQAAALPCRMCLWFHLGMICKEQPFFQHTKLRRYKGLVPRIQCFYWSRITGQFPHYSPPLLFWLCCRTTQAAFNQKNL